MNLLNLEESLDIHVTNNNGNNPSEQGTTGIAAPADTYTNNSSDRLSVDDLRSIDRSSHQEGAAEDGETAEDDPFEFMNRVSKTARLPREVMEVCDELCECNGVILTLTTPIQSNLIGTTTGSGGKSKTHGSPNNSNTLNQSKNNNSNPSTPLRNQSSYSKSHTAASASSTSSASASKHTQE